jgi:hypothetical protein
MRLTAARRILPAAFAALCAIGFAHARSLSETEKEGVRAAAAEVAAAFAVLDAQRISRVESPPRYVELIASKRSVSAEKQHDISAKKIAHEFEKRGATSIAFAFEIDLDGADARDISESEGGPAVWAVVQTKMRVAANGNSLDVELPCLALQDRGAWYFFTKFDRNWLAAYPYLKDAGSEM